MDRTGTRVTVVPQKEKKNYDFQANILELCLECLDKGVVPTQEVPNNNNNYHISGYISVSNWRGPWQEKETLI